MVLSETGARLLTWLESTSLSVWARDSVWVYPLIETAHILGFTVLVGSAFMFDLRLLGFAPSVPVTDAARYLLRWSRLSLLVVVPTGFMLFMTQATETWANSAFRMKLLLLCVASLNALVFHLWTIKSVGEGGQHKRTSVAAKVSAIVSLLVWAGVITCGRLIAYL
jgi:hypothetical protein